MKYTQTFAVLALFLQGTSASQNSEISKKLDQLKLQIKEDVKITNKLKKSLKNLKKGGDETLVVINQGLDLHKFTAHI